MKIDSGKLNIRLEIQQPVFTIQSGESIISSWTLYYKTWAMRNQVTGGEKEEVEAMQMVSSDYTEFTIRYPNHLSIPNTKMKVVETILGVEYNIENIRIMGLNQFLVLVCKQRQQK